MIWHSIPTPVIHDMCHSIPTPVIHDMTFHSYSRNTWYVSFHSYSRNTCYVPLFYILFVSNILYSDLKNVHFLNGLQLVLSCHKLVTKLYIIKLTLIFTMYNFNVFYGWLFNFENIFENSSLSLKTKKVDRKIVETYKNRIIEINCLLNSMFIINSGN